MIKVSIEIDGRTVKTKDITKGLQTPITGLLEVVLDTMQGFGVLLDPEMLAMYFSEQAGIFDDDYEEDVGGNK